MKTLSIAKKVSFLTKLKTLIGSKIAPLFQILLLFFAPVGGLFFVVCLAACVDTGFVVWKIKKKKLQFSWKLCILKTGSKILWYVGLVALCFTLDQKLINEFTAQVISIKFISTKLLSGILCYIEVKSSDAHFKDVKGYSFIQKLATNITKLKEIKQEIQ